MTDEIKQLKLDISKITERISTRSIKPLGVERLRQKIIELGYLPEKPIVVTPNETGYTLIDGNHRVKALEELGINQVDALIDDALKTTALQYRRARLANEVAETIVPTTFVDDAELVWRLLDKENGSMTQTEVGSVLGIGRGQVNHYVRLKGIDTETWEIVSNHVEATVSTNDTVVSFSEGQLRQILPLTPAQQLELVQDFTNGKIDSKKFKQLSERYKLRNSIRDYVFEQLSGIPIEFIKARIEDIDKGGFDKDWQEGKTRIDQLITSIREEHEKKSGTQLILGDFEAEVLTIDDGIVDLILTDPPYNISGQGKVTKEGNEIVNSDFGDWDEVDDFLPKLKDWATQWARILKPGGSLIVFTDRLLISDLWRMLEEGGLQGKQIIVWHKTNPNPSAFSRRNLVSATEFMLWAVKPGGSYVFNKTDLWDMCNSIEAPLCSGNERLKDANGDTLHPTQKPLAVLEPLIEVFSNRGSLVLDGFAGVGSTGEAAIKRGRKFIGIENKEIFFEAMRLRLV